MVVEFYSKIFIPSVQLGLKEALWNLKEDLTIPLATTYGMLYIRGAEVPTYSIIFIEDEDGF